MKRIQERPHKSGLERPRYPQSQLPTDLYGDQREVAMVRNVLEVDLRASEELQRFLM